MGKIVGRRSSIDPHYIEEFEEWLTYMARKGLVFDHMDKKKCYFEKTEPKEMEYRIISKGSLLTLEKEKEFEEAGYEYIAAEENIHVFAVESGFKRYTVYRDINMEIEALQKYRNKQYKDMVFSTGVLIGIMLLLYFTNKHTFPIATFLIANTIFSVPLIFLWILQMVYSIQNIVYTTRRIHQLKEREDVRYSIKWNSKNLLHIGMHLVGIGLILLPIAFNLIQLGSILLDMESDVIEKRRPAVVATLKEIEQNQTLKTEGDCPENDKRLYESLIIKNDTVYREDVVKRTKDGPAYGNEAIRYIAECFELRSDWMMERFMKEQMQIATRNFVDEEIVAGKIQRVAVGEVDHAFYMPTSRNDEYSVCIAKGTTIVYTYYRGDKSYEELLSIMKDKLVQNL